MAALPSVPDGHPVSEEATPDDPLGVRCAHEPRCDVRHVGYLRVAQYRGINCDRPLLVRLSCGGHDVWACGNHRESRCVPCSWRYRRRLARIAEAGSRATGYLYLLTLTAPGDELHHLPNGEPCPCTPPGGVDLSAWNPSAAGFWNHLRTALRRERPDLEYLRAVEVQDRGALHLHVIVWSSQPLDVVHLRRLAIRCGFGHSTDLAPIVAGSKRHAYYVAKYVTKACDSRDDVPWRREVVDQDTGELRRLHTIATYRTWSSSQGWGLTMKEVRRACRQAVEASKRAQVLRDQVPRVPGSGSDGTPGERTVPGVPPPPAPPI